MRISDWSSDVCSSDLDDSPAAARPKVKQRCDHGLVEPRLWARRAVAWRFRCPLWLRREQHGDGSDENEHCHRGEDPEPADDIRGADRPATVGRKRRGWGKGGAGTWQVGGGRIAK